MDKSGKTHVQLLKYFVSGGMAFLSYILILFVLTEYLRVFHLVSLIIAYLASILINFNVSKYFVFKDGSQKTAVQFFKFFTVAMIGLAAQFLIVYLLTKFVVLNYITANVIASGLIYFVSFSLNKIFTFRPKSGSG